MREGTLELQHTPLRESFASSTLTLRVTRASAGLWTLASVKGRPTTRLPDLDLALTLPRRLPVTGCVLSMPRKGPGAVALSCWISCGSLSSRRDLGTQGDPQGSPPLVLHRREREPISCKG